MNRSFDTITVMDYCYNEVRVFRNVDTNSPEEWLEEHDARWNNSTCYYMYGEDTKVNEYERYTWQRQTLDQARINCIH